MAERETNNQTLNEILSSLKWRTAMNKWYPHQYIVRTQGTATAERFDQLASEIQASPYYDFWKGERMANLFVDGYKFWQIQDVINRKPAKPPTDGYDGGETCLKVLKERQKNANTA